MSCKRSVFAIAITALMLLASLFVFLSQSAKGSAWVETSDTDFSDGDFLNMTELHGTGIDAYVQSRKDMTNWILKSPTTATGPRRSFGFANDSHEGRFILFGGVDENSMARNDTWEYNYSANNWEKICDDDTPACGPPRRVYASMAYDNNSKVVVMHGGYAADWITLLGDTWEYDVTNNTWTNRTPLVGGPRGLVYSKMVYDAVGKQMVMIGRSTGMEVWVYNTAAHAWTRKTPSGGPSLRTGYALAYSYQVSHTRVVLFGGGELTTQYGDTWEYNPQANTWTETTNPVDNPSARSSAAMTYIFKTSLEGILLWGGNSYSTETWRYFWDDSAIPPIATWVMVTTTVSPDPPRTEHGLAYDTGHDALVLYGGLEQLMSRLNDTWSLEAGYRIDARYKSSVLNTGVVTTQWQYIFWNQTPADVPPNTQIRFQVNVSNTCDDANMNNFYGPGKNPSLYFVNPGDSIGLSGFKCIRYFAQLLTFDPTVAPRLEDVTIIYNATGTNKPKVVSVSPTFTNNPLDSWIYINFTKPMDRTNVWLSIVPNVTDDKPWEWQESDSKVIIRHSTQLFIEGKRYDLCVWGTDLLGQVLDHTMGNPYNLVGYGKYCWLFVTRAIAPWIESTNPSQGQTGVSISAPIRITFSEAMNTSTCWPDITIAPSIAFTPSWNSPTDTILTLNHAAPFEQLTTYTVDVPIGDPARPCKDKSGILLTVGPAPDPWYFTTEALNPYIVSTDPTHLQPSVPVTQVIQVTFSRFMNEGSMTNAFKDLITGQNWTGILTIQWPNNMTLRFSHSTNFDYCRPYQMQIWALDFTSKSLIANPDAPNPWRFQTTGSGSSGCAPYMMFTRPGNGERDVPVWKNISIYWHYDPAAPAGGMNEASFTFSVKDSFGTELRSRFDPPQWTGMGPDVVELFHPGYQFQRCMEYTVTVLTARDKNNRIFIPGIAENPFKFTTDMTPPCPPYILWTQPANNTLNVPFDQPIVVKFSVPMNTNQPPFSFGLKPSALPYNYTWTESDTNLTVTHTAFTPCKWYNVTIFGVDTNGNPLVPGPVPNPWRFRAFCPPNGTYIVNTTPAAGQNNVSLTWPIWINFTDPMDTSSLVFTLSPPAGTLSYDWINGNRTVIVNHSSLFIECTVYTANVVQARNKSGGPIVAGPVPNPWTFRARCVYPFITGTLPPNGDSNVPLGDTITVIFSEPMNPSSLEFSTQPSHTYSASWPNAQMVVLSHSTPFLRCEPYVAFVSRARDLDGNNIIPGPVPNPWSFTSDCRFPTYGLQVRREPPDVRLTWKASPEAQYYKVFHSNDKFTPWPLWTEIANVTTTFFVANNHISDMQNHFYIVRGYNATTEGSNSTMGVLWHPSIALNPLKTNTYWFSLPYNAFYKKASDIATELGPSKVTVIAKWDPARQQSILYYYLRGKWRGTDFPISAGNGLWLSIQSSFDWALNGTDKSPSLVFVFNLNPDAKNIHWVGLPYTGKIGSARDLVTSIAGGTGPGTNTKIIVVGKWVYSRQESDIYRYTPTGWDGVNFQINPGDGIWMEIVSTFGWTPELITAEMP